MIRFANINSKNVEFCCLVPENTIESPTLTILDSVTQEKLDWGDLTFKLYDNEIYGAKKPLDKISSCKYGITIDFTKINKILPGHILLATYNFIAPHTKNMMEEVYIIIDRGIDLKILDKYVSIS